MWFMDSTPVLPVSIDDSYGNTFVHVLHQETYVVGKIPERVFNIDNLSPVARHWIEARILATSFSVSVRHDTPLLYFWGCISHFIRPLSFSSWVLSGLLALILLR